MNKYFLPYGSISILKKNIAEVIISEGIEMDDKIVDDYHRFLKTHLKGDFSILVNKKHSYSYTFNAQKMIGSLKEIKAIGVVNHTSGGELSTQTLKQVNNKKLNLKSFLTREEALIWLEEQ